MANKKTGWKRETGYLYPYQRDRIEELLRMQADGWVLHHAPGPVPWWMRRGMEFHSIHTMLGNMLRQRGLVTPLATLPTYTTYAIKPLGGKKGVDSEGYPR